ncbi:MAG: AraC family transcriptional regulator [Beijerinckiaceae bacterium]
MGVDPLSDVLRAVRLTGAIFFDIKLYEPWVAATPTAQQCVPFVMPHVEHLLEYHIIAEGGCWAGLADGELLRVEAGDVIAFPQGDAHILASAPHLRAEPDFAMYRAAQNATLPFAHSHGDESGARTRVICGFLGCAARPFNPLLSALPRLLHDRAAHRTDRWITDLARLAVAESESRSSGGQSVLERVSELMFIAVVRRYLNALPGEQTGWLAGLRDRYVGHVLGLLHARPAHPWTIDELAREAGMSRSSLAERFVHFVGQPPMQYLTQWRMQMASDMLGRGSDSVGRIAAAVGYDSEAAFNRAFKKIVGTPPGAWRRTQTLGSDESHAALTPQLAVGPRSA